MTTSAITSTKDLLPELTLVSQGKVRGIYSTSDPSTLLFVATDRISAYDVILKNVGILIALWQILTPLPGVPGKGVILSQLTLFWFKRLENIIPNHLITDDVEQMPPKGYITGSAWSEYKHSGTIHGNRVLEGLVESQKLPKPLFMPSTKAELGQHDENIHPDQAAKIVGKDLCDRISSDSVRIYKEAAEYAATHGVILTDTKLKFGLVDVEGQEPQLILIDEVLIPDSSRYWPTAGYSPRKHTAT
ncbi:Bifunctional purine biosynthetic protein ade1 [Ceratobasidium sp. UAMH 11750]|nr:Bifunctional purine biosynthetic protein ade1 [Ceratobasidium sp. UAMH 11750]